MKKLTGILALLLCLVLTVGCFVSCDKVEGTQDGNNSDQTQNENNNPEEDNKPVEEPLPLDKYTVTSSIRFATNDNKMKDAVASMNSSVVVNVDKENVYVNLVSENGDISVNKSYTLYDGILYLATEASVGEYSVAEYEKSAMSDTDVDTLLKNVGVGASIGIGDFKTHNMSISGGLTTYTCTDITEASRLSISQILASGFEGTDATVEIKSAAYTLEAKGDYNDNSIFSCNLAIHMDGYIYEITVHITNTYTYSNDVSVSLPQDADKYVETSRDDIIG